MPLSDSVDFRDGEDAYFRGDYATAIRKSRLLAERDHASAQYRLGVMYTFGHGVQQDDVEAVKWFRKALDKLQLGAGQGDAGAQFRLGGMYHNGWGVRQDYAEAVKWYRRAAERGMSGEMVPQMYGRHLSANRHAAQSHGFSRSTTLRAGWRHRPGQRQASTSIA